jgi:L-gulonate 3-dehydrogenase
MRAAVIGAGLIGRAWAMVFARVGWEVSLYDGVPAQLDSARVLMAEDLLRQQASGLAKDAAAAMGRIAYHLALPAALADADWVQENLPEDEATKREVFAALDAGAGPEAVLASSTSAIPSSRFTQSLEGRHRCLVAHPVNPPHLVPVVELCGAPWTSAATLDRARDVMTAIGQVPVLVRRELDGFVLNRLQGALLSEAMRLVGEGYVSAADLDLTVSEGLGLRWSFMGPFATIVLNAPGGVADYCARYSGFYKRLADDPPGAAVWDAANAERVVAALGAAPDVSERERRSAWRNARLLALRRHKHDEEALREAPKAAPNEA